MNRVASNAHKCNQIWYLIATYSDGLSDLQNYINVTQILEDDWLLELMEDNCSISNWSAFIVLAYVLIVCIKWEPFHYWWFGL